MAEICAQEPPDESVDSEEPFDDSIDGMIFDCDASRVGVEALVSLLRRKLLLGEAALTGQVHGVATTNSMDYGLADSGLSANVIDPIDASLSLEPTPPACTAPPLPQDLPGMLTCPATSSPLSTSSIPGLPTAQVLPFVAREHDKSFNSVNGILSQKTIQAQTIKLEPGAPGNDFDSPVKGKSDDRSIEFDSPFKGKSDYGLIESEKAKPDPSKSKSDNKMNGGGLVANLASAHQSHSELGTGSETQSTLGRASPKVTRELDDALGALPRNRKARLENDSRMGHFQHTLQMQATKMSLMRYQSDRHVFADVDKMKSDIRAAIARPAYNVTTLYAKGTYWTQIATSEYFEYLTLSIIVINACWIAVDADHNNQALLKDSDAIFIIMENLFCVYFGFELLVRFMAFEKKAAALRDSWFVFDLVLVLMMVIETWIFTIVFSMINFSGAGLRNASILKLIRLLRLTRMARVAKLLASMPELTILLKGIVAASRSVFFTLILMGVIVFVFAVAMRQLTDGTELGRKYFDSVPAAMGCLFLNGALPDQTDLVEELGGFGLWMAFILIFFLGMASLTVMNMLIGILCDVVHKVSDVEKEQLQVQSVKRKLFQMLVHNGIDSDEDMHISREEFAQLLTNPKAAKAIQEVGVDAVALVDYADLIFSQGSTQDGVSFAEFIQVMLQFRGSNNATVKDIVDLHKLIKRENDSVLNSVQQILHQQLKRAEEKARREKDKIGNRRDQRQRTSIY